MYQYSSLEYSFIFLFTFEDIATTSAPPGNPNLSIRNPLPDTGGIDTMVLISNRIVIGILKAAFDNDGSFPWHMQLVS